MEAAKVEEIRRRLGFPRGASTPPRGSCEWWWLLLLRVFGHKGPEEPIPVDKPLDAEQLKRLRQERIKAREPGHFQRLARDRRLVMECLCHYNSTHPNMEYEPAPGEVIRYYGRTKTHFIIPGPDNMEHLKRIAEEMQKQVAAKEEKDDEVPDLVLERLLKK
ncbi:hypothetical protein PR202_gb10236 [Eleusine coracana subsp. coracana]|uniref:Uncharacterized protein n=1 Tax=Eleusine coracana subsp. coracana TaxID=191504 RepID=A0AAV5EH15_ELECO|nr:hypothetical protein PR202_gb10236 [Eleusine coracana subsp. coracana]